MLLKKHAKRQNYPHKWQVNNLDIN